MAYVIAILITLILFIGFLGLTSYEERRGYRFFAGARYQFDTKVSRALFIVAHVDWASFTQDLVRSVSRTLAHDVVHGTLIAVRALERVLTRTMRVLRSGRETRLEAGTARPEGRIQGAVGYLKQNLRRSRKLTNEDSHGI